MAINKRLDYDPKQNACEDAYTKMLENRQKRAEEQAKEQARLLEESKNEKLEETKATLFGALADLEKEYKGNKKEMFNTLYQAIAAALGDKAAAEFVKTVK